MSEHIAICRSAEELHRALRARADHLQIARDTIDEVAGLPRGYAAKLLCDPPVKNLGPVSAFPMIGALGMAVVLIEDPGMMVRVNKQARRVETNVRNGNNARGVSIIERTFKKFGQMGAIAFMEKVSPARRSANARKAAKARWRKQSSRTKP